jgi:hypothetical protein
VVAENETAKGCFFHIDRRTWILICGHDNVNMATAYLCIAVGTNRGNRGSFWSAQAIEKYTGLHWTRAKKAIGNLVDLGYIQRGDKSTRTRPVYELRTFADILASAQVRESVAELIAKYNSLARTSSMKQHAEKRSYQEKLEQLAKAGIVWKLNGSYVSDAPAESNLIWLPNSLVTGTPEGEASPVKRLRSLGDIWSMRLFVQLYEAQNLSADGGISRDVLRTVYTKKKFGESRQYIILGFTSKHYEHNNHEILKDLAALPQSAAADTRPIWAVIHTLVAMGLMVEIPHLVENANHDCEPIHALGWEGGKSVGEPAERDLAILSFAAAKHLLGGKASQLTNADDRPTLAVPVFKTQTKVEVVGIFRLTYRPQTQMTSDWYRKMTKRAAEWCEIYKRLGPTEDTLQAAGF